MSTSIYSHFNWQSIFLGIPFANGFCVNWTRFRLTHSPMTTSFVERSSFIDLIRSLRLNGGIFSIVGHVQTRWLNWLMEESNFIRLNHDIGGKAGINAGITNNLYCCTKIGLSGENLLVTCCSEIEMVRYLWVIIKEIPLSQTAFRRLICSEINRIVMQQAMSTSIYSHFKMAKHLGPIILQAKIQSDNKPKKLFTFQL